jgi:hypothetical protein
MAGLIITNGDSAADLLRAAGRTEIILPWRDVLHEGPITATDLDLCTRMRVEYLAARFALEATEVAAEFAARDGLVHRHAEFDPIELWFEHDLYDQLQLIQVLAFFAGERRTAGVRLVQADDFLGTQTPRTILRFADQARAVTGADLDLAAAVWRELAAPTPVAIAERAVSGGRSPLTFLPAALKRFLEELPSSTNGLGRSEQTILDLVGSGERGTKSAFVSALALEEAVFMGDASFFRLIEDLCFCAVPLLAGLAPRSRGDDDASRFDDAELELTPVGEDVREEAEDHVELSGLDRWWGGTRLLGNAVWRYDRQGQRLVAPGKSGA